MFSFLKNHPFPVEARFEHSLVLTFAVPASQVSGRLPPCLVPDTFNDRWAFIAVALVQARDLRPAGFPALLGSDFFLIGYRIFVRYTNTMGQRLRGLFILKSETNRRKMEWLGNLFTSYNYTTTDIRETRQDHRWLIESVASGLEVETSSAPGPVSLPAGSPFADWTEARRFAGPLPFTFSWKPATRQVLIIEGVRQHWKPEPVEVIRHRFAFLESLGCPGLILANAFSLQDIPYRWKKGRLESWNP